MTLKVGDRVKLLYNHFLYCPKETIVKISEVENNGTFHFIHNKTRYTVAECDVEPIKEVVQFT